MTETETAWYWNQNAPAWTMLARAGYDIYRDHLNTPAFFKMLPDVKGLAGIDIGCGEGYNTRLLADRGAKINAIDISPVFIEKATEAEAEFHLDINYSVASATELPFQNNSFAFATSFMCLMGIADPEKALQEAYRVLKPGGFLQFSIEHPCFTTPHRKKIYNSEGIAFAVEVGYYFKGLHGEISEWVFGNAPDEVKHKAGKFKVPTFHRTLTFWMNAIIKAGFIIEEINEPFPDNKLVQQIPRFAATKTVAYFLHVRCRKIQEE